MRLTAVTFFFMSSGERIIEEYLVDVVLGGIVDGGPSTGDLLSRCLRSSHSIQCQRMHIPSVFTPTWIRRRRLLLCSLVLAIFVGVSADREV